MRKLLCWVDLHTYVWTGAYSDGHRVKIRELCLSCGRRRKRYVEMYRG